MPAQQPASRVSVPRGDDEYAIERSGFFQAPTEATPQIVEQVRTLFTGAAEAMVATEGNTHVVRQVNAAFCSLLGQNAGVLVGRPLGTLLSSRPQAQDEALLDLVYATGTPEFGVDLARMFGGVEPLILPCIVWPILGTNDRPRGLLIRVGAPTNRRPMRPVDIASRRPPTRPAEADPVEQLREVNQRLVFAGLEAQQQAEVQTTLRGEAEAALTMRDEFISIAAHELRTPVTGIKTAAQLALRTLKDANLTDERVIKYLTGIIDGANRLTLLTRDLMDVSQMRSGRLLLRVKSVDLVALVRSVTLRYAEAGLDPHRVILDVPTTPVVVSADRVRLEQILDNLLSNSVKYSPAGGEIRVALVENLDGTVLTVGDDGIGLTPGAHERIFEPFGRAANATEQGVPGMGLGLHICRQIAQAHGGRMWAESAGEGKGMTVALWLPGESSA
jgi:signal transduction histidine kinase